MIDIYEGNVKIDDTSIDYTSFGFGDKPFVYIPGVSLLDVKGNGQITLGMFQEFVQDYRVYCIDRRNDIHQPMSVKEIADDVAYVMKEIGIKDAYVLGISLGGMIVQELAIHYPELVKKLCLAVTTSRFDENTKKGLESWITLAKEGNFEAISNSSYEYFYTPEYIEKNALLFSQMAKVLKPRDPVRFGYILGSMINFNAYDELDKIHCPTFVIGAENDKVVTAQASLDIANKLHCPVYIYPKYGHGVFDEQREDFNQKILEFYKK